MSVYAGLCDCAKLVLALKSLCVMCFKFSSSVCVCVYISVCMFVLVLPTVAGLVNKSCSVQDGAAKREAG